MRREVTLEEISDGRLYEANDMVKADCQDCKSPVLSQAFQPVQDLLPGIRWMYGG